MTDRLKPLEVKTINIASKVVTTDKIADKAIDNRTIKEGAVTPDKLSITPASRPLTPPVDTAEIKDGAVTPAKMSVTPVTRPLNPPVGTDEIRDGAITKAKLADGTIGTTEIIDGSVTTPKLAPSSVTQTKIAAGAVRGTEIADGVVSNAKLSTAAVTPPKVDAVNTPTDGQALTYEQTSGRFKYVTPAAGLTRPITPPIETAEIGDAQVTPVKLSFTPVTRPLSPRIATDEIEDGAITPQKLSFTPGGSRFTLINPQTVFDETATTDRSAPLDLSAVIPATAVGVLVELHQDGQVPGWAQPSALIQHPLGGMALTVYITGNSAGNMPMYQDNAGIVPVYSPQNIYLVINRVGVSTRVKVTVVGYIE